MLPTLDHVDEQALAVGGWNDPACRSTPRGRRPAPGARSRARRRPASVPGAVLPAEPVTAAAIAEHAQRRRARPLPPRSGISAGDLPPDLRTVMPRWTSRKAYNALVTALAGTEGLRVLCRDVGTGIAPSTWAAAMLVIAEHADTATGELRASQERIADRLGRSPRTVRRALAVARALGLAVEVYRGRDLGLHERRALVEEHGTHPQRGIPSVWQLGFCPPARRARFSTPRPGRFCSYNGFDHLPPKGASSHSTHLWKLLTTTAADAARETEAASPPPKPRRRRPGSALAIELLASPHQRFILGVSPGRLAGLLAPFQHGGWRGDDLALVLVDEARRRKWDITTPAWAPLAALRILLEHVDPVADPSNAWADLCELCYRSPGRRRTLPLGPVSVCPPCWENARHHHEPEPCQHPGCDHGWITLAEAQDGRHGLVRRCPSCGPA